MLRRLSLRWRRTIAPLTLAIALGPVTGCGYVQRMMPWHDHAADGYQLQDAGQLDQFETRVHEVGKDRSSLEQPRERLRRARARAWARVAEGGTPTGFSMDDALALSVIEQQLDAGMRWDHAPPSSAVPLAELPRAYWWYLMVAPSAWANGPLAIDRERAPGYYAAMMGAFEHVLARPPAPGQPFTVDSYLELHRLATLGVYDRECRAPIRPGFTQAPLTQPVVALHDPGQLHVEHLAQSLTELRAEGVAGWNGEIQRERSDDVVPAWIAKVLDERQDVNPGSKPVTLLYRREHDAHGGHAVTEWLEASSRYAHDEARRWTAQWFSEYAAAQAKTPHRTPAEYLDLLAAEAPGDDFAMAMHPSAKPADDLTSAIRPIAQLIRRLEVSHAFADRTDALDVMLLLDYLLITNGLPPAIIGDPSMFAGREALDELVAEIVQGQRRYQLLVRELGARAAAEGAR